MLAVEDDKKEEDSENMKKRLEEEDDENGKKKFVKEDEFSKKSLRHMDVVAADGTVQGGSMHERESDGVRPETSPSFCATRQALEAKRSHRGRDVTAKERDVVREN